MRPQVISLYDSVAESLKEFVTPSLFTKTALVHLSHLLEDVVLTNHLPALMFTGFQVSSHWQQETQRYIELAQVARQVCIFSGNPLPDDFTGSLIQVELADGDPLRQEWFVIILSSEFSVVLCGKEELKEGEIDDAWREFETLFSFEPQFIERVADLLEGILEHYRPDLLDDLRRARRDFLIQPPNIRWVTHIITHMMSFEMTLKRQLLQSSIEQARVNYRLKQQRHLNELMVETSAIMMAVADMQSNVVRANAMFWNTLELEEGAYIGKNLPRTFVHPDDHPLMGDIYQRLMADEDVAPFQFRYVSASGRVIPTEWYMLLFRDEEGNPEFIYGFGIDETARKRAQQMLLEQEGLRVALEKERELNDLRLAFMITVSHEFRTPLSTILSSAELLEMMSDKLTPESLLKRVGKIKTQVFYLTELVEKMAIIIEAESPYQSLSLIDLNLVSYVQGLIDDVRFSMRNTHIVHFDHALFNSDVVLADATLIRHIVVNLVQNAIKFSASSRDVTVRLKEEQYAMLLEVIDNGIGISEADQQRVLEPFYKGGNVGAIGGAGLGLKIVWDCVRLYGGNIQILSKEGKGTNITVRLPLRQDDE